VQEEGSCGKEHFMDPPRFITARTRSSMFAPSAAAPAASLASAGGMAGGKGGHVGHIRDASGKGCAVLLAGGQGRQLGGRGLGVGKEAVLEHACVVLG
jgi:hypothetical protein